MSAVAVEPSAGEKPEDDGGCCQQMLCSNQAKSKMGQLYCLGLVQVVAGITHIRVHASTKGIVP